MTVRQGPGHSGYGFARRHIWRPCYYAAVMQTAAITSRPFLASAAAKRRVVGVALLLVILVPFAALNRLPKLDTVREDLGAALAPTAQCFQGFCIEDPDRASERSGFFARWWRFSVTYLQLVAIGMLFAFAAAAIAEAFLVSDVSVRAGLAISDGRPGRWQRIMKGIGLGPVLNLCSACIAPVSSTLRRGGMGVEGALALVHGSATLNVPSLLMIAVVFTPLLGASRLTLGLVAAFSLGPLVAWATRRRGASGASVDDRASAEVACAVPVVVAETATWSEVLRTGGAQWLRSFARLVRRMLPLMIVAGFASGAAIQALQPETVTSYLGESLLGVVIASTLGVLINVPLLFEIPLVALLLILGAGTAPAAALLFAAAAGGPVTFLALSKALGRRGVAVYAGGTWAVAVLGGCAVLLLGALLGPERAALRLDGGAATDRASYVGAVPNSIVLATCASETALCPDQSGLSWPHTPTGHGHSVVSAGGAVGDFDRDGWQDLFVPSGGTMPDRLYMNNGDGTFTDRAVEAGIAARHHGYGAAVGDVDSDGWLDIFVISYGTVDQRFTMPGNHRLYRNNGDGTFTDIAARAGVTTTSPKQPTGTGASFGDYDLDGDLDLAVASWFYGKGANALFRNNGDGTFENVTSLLPFDGKRAPQGYTPLFADMDGDRYPELLWAADYFTSRYLRNDGGNGFTDITEQSRTGLDANGMGATAADLDNDGRLDWFVTSVSTRFAIEGAPGTGNFLYRNTGDHLYESVGDSAGVEEGGWGWGAVAVDLDHDGWLDLVQTNGWEGHNSRGDPEWQSETTRVFRNLTGAWDELAFADVAEQAGLVHREQGRGLVHLDYDNDGDQDLVIFNNGGLPTLVRNELNPDSDGSGRWLRVFLDTAARADLAPDGIGSVVAVRAGDTRQVRYVGAAAGYLGPSELSAHFGLGAAPVVDELQVQWPDGSTSTYHQVPTNRTLTIAAR